MIENTYKTKTFKLKNLKFWHKGKRTKAIKLIDFTIRDFVLRRIVSGKYRSIHDIYSLLPELKGEYPPPNVPFFYTAADPHYIDLFSESFIGSIYTNSPKSAIHIHIYDPTDSTISLIKEIKNKNPEIQLTISYEESNIVPSLPPHKRVIYFQSMRFVRLWQIIEETGSPAVAIDIDSLVLGSMDSIISEAKISDIGIVLRRDAYDSSRRILASFLYISKSKKALDFIRCCATRIAYHLYYSVQTEMLDQRALWLALEKRLNTISIWEAPKKFYDYEFQKSSLIWQAKGKRKNDEGFQQEALKYTAHASLDLK